MDVSNNYENRRQLIEKAKLQILNEALSLTGLVILLWEHDSDTVHYVSPGVNKWGYSPSHFKTKEDVLKLIYDDDRDIVLDALKTEYSDNKTNWFDFRIILRDGSVRNIHAKQNVLNNFEDILLSRIIFVDITPNAELSALNTDSFSLVDVFDIAVLRQYAQSLSETEGLPCYILDDRGELIVQSMKKCPLRDYVRSSDLGESLCKISDDNLMLMSSEQRSHFSGYCDCTGLFMTCAPIIINSQVVGYWMYGQVRTEALNESNIIALANRLSLDHEKALELFSDMPIYTADEAERLADAVRSSAAELTEVGQRDYLLRNENENIVQTKQFITQNLEQQNFLSSVYELLLNSDDTYKTIETCFKKLSRFYLAKSAFLFENGEYVLTFPYESALLPEHASILCMQRSFYAVNQGEIFYIQNFSGEKNGLVGISVENELSEDEVTFVSLILQNISAFWLRHHVSEKVAEQTKELEYISSHDTALNILNRSSLERRLHDLLDFDESGRPVGTFFAIEIDNLPIINNAYGYDVGEMLMKSVADFLCNSLIMDIYRFSSDAFGVWINEYDGEKIEQVVDIVLDRFKDPWDLNGKLTYSTVSCGTTPICGTARSFFQNVNLTLNAATDRGRNSYYKFNNALKSDALYRLNLANELYAAAQKGFGQFQVYAQPIVDIKNKRWSHVEALLRWHHPERGMIAPYEFIPVAEETTLIVPLSMFMIREALRQISNLRKNGMPWLKLNVNFSTRLAHQEKIMENILDILKEEDAPPECLTVDITESMANFDIQYMENFIQDCTKKGVSVSLDDFGIGHSSLSSLRDLSMNTIKLDKSVSLALPKSKYSLSILNFVSEISETLGCSVCCEGIETTEALSAVVDAGVDYVQGFLFSKPLPFDKLEELLLNPQSTVKIAEIINQAKTIRR